jgi:hypothetical protein
VNAPLAVPDVADIADLRALAARLFDELAACSETERGITRECFADGENKALKLIRDTAVEFGLACHSDRVGNLIVAAADDDLTAFCERKGIARVASLTGAVRDQDMHVDRMEALP